MPSSSRSGSGSHRRYQRGVMLLEAVIGVLLFAIGLLALIAMQANAVRHSAAGKYRTDAMLLANEIVAQIWTDPVNIADYAHMPGGAACTPSGGSTASPSALDWLSRVGATLPGADSNKQQIIVGVGGLVTVRLCWQAPGDATPHNVALTAQVVP